MWPVFAAHLPFNGGPYRCATHAVFFLAWVLIASELPAAEGEYVGVKVCAGCHEQQAANWKGSDHDLAMREATKETVRGDFGGAQFTAHGVTSTFSERHGKYFVHTDGPDGKLHEYQIVYTFGVRPLQQYLVAFPKGRHQALSVAWDTRPKEQGGQRWFHLHPDENITHDDVLHWTGVAQNWNTMCADCHSTNLRKGYRAGEDRYETTWSEINVACEACHGPGAEHVAWARLPEEERRTKKSDGIRVRLPKAENAAWIFPEGEHIARRSPPLTAHIELETCAPCHSRRSEIAPRDAAGGAYLDRYRPALLSEDLYHADGQIEDEVYVYGSFLQSRMYRAGVTCSDCHDPHSLKTVGGNAVCSRCHASSAYDTDAHHHHPVGSKGAQCVECHMPEKTYMVVDPRRDHSFRVLRPDLSRSIGVPNACAGCHADKTNEWADEAVRNWYGNSRRPHFGEDLHAGRQITADAGNRLVNLANDPTQPGIARATAIAMLSSFPSSDATAAISAAAGDSDPLLRIAAAEALSFLAPEARLPLLGPLLEDSLRAVRIEAGRALAPLLRGELDAQQRSALTRAVDEYRDAQAFNADRPEAHVNLGTLALELGQPAEAQAAYERALEIGPYFIPAYVNLADLYRVQKKDEEGEKLLRKALAFAPRNAAVHHALGLLQVREQRLPEALEELRLAATLDPDDPYYAYVYAMGLNATGRGDAALQVLRETHREHSGHRETLFALATMSRDQGELDQAYDYAAKLAGLAPGDSNVEWLLTELKEARRRLPANGRP